MLEQTASRDKPTPLDEAEERELDVTPVKSIRSSRSNSAPLPPSRPSNLGSAVGKASGKQAMN